MKRLVMAITLSCALSASTLAGDVPSGGFTAPPPPPSEPTPTTSTTAPGDIPSGGFTQEISEAALTLIQSLFGAVV